MIAGMIEAGLSPRDPARWWLAYHAERVAEVRAADGSVGRAVPSPGQQDSDIEILGDIE